MSIRNLMSDGESAWRSAMVHPMVSNKPAPQKTIEALLDASGREHLPLAKSFVQSRDTAGKGRPGPLSRFVGHHHERALRQYLLLHSVASGGKYDAAYPSQVWARGLRLDGTQLSARNSISRTWAWLDRQRLVERSRAGRDAKVTLLYDDGSGSPYVHPHDRTPQERYLRLPYAFWREQWDAKLDLAATAVLLILLHEKAGFVPLTAERMPDWYGISVSTFEKGVQALRRADLLERRRDEIDAPLSAIGKTFVYRYRLIGSFGRGTTEKSA